MIFDPFRWLERFLPARQLHRCIRLVAISWFGVFFYIRIVAYPAYLVKSLWVVETLIYVLIILAFVIRTDPVERSRGVREIIVPLIGESREMLDFLPFVKLKCQLFTCSFEHSPETVSEMGHREFGLVTSPSRYEESGRQCYAEPAHAADL